jgi:FkbM family methyltransferase
MLRPIKNIIKKAVFRFIEPPILEVKNTYAQAGEDVIMKFLFDLRNIPTPTYLDLGVNSPDQHNNTYLFYKAGASGVCIDANAALIKAVKDMRPRDIVLNVGVGIDDNTEADFYVFNDHALNTFDREEAEFRERHGTFKIEKKIKVKLASINKIISDNYDTYPDILSMDIEGLDLEVLKTLDFNKYPVPVICVETCTYSENHIKPKNQNILDFMASNDYFVYGDTYINTIFVNKKWFYS